MKNIAVLLAGSGVYDGSEIHESVFSLYSIAKLGMKSVCFAPNRDQFHVINHLNGEEQTNEKRNILQESARIARGEVQPLEKADFDTLDALVIPGGFGAAKNLNQWAINGADGKIFPDVKTFILKFIATKKPIVALCMGPTVVAKALEDQDFSATLTVGSSEEKSPYDIAGISEGMQSLGSTVEMKTIDEISIDKTHNIISAPCYMMEADITQVAANIEKAIEALKDLL